MLDARARRCLEIVSGDGGAREQEMEQVERLLQEELELLQRRAERAEMEREELRRTRAAAEREKEEARRERDKVAAERDAARKSCEEAVSHVLILVLPAEAASS